jgi:hypothetical protein
MTFASPPVQGVQFPLDKESPSGTETGGDERSGMHAPHLMRTQMPAEELAVVAPRYGEESDRSKGPFAFRFIVRFGPQLSTPCSRSVEIGPQTEPAPLAPFASLFQRHLRCHTFVR